MAVLEVDEYKKTVDPANLMRSKKTASESAFQSAGEMKKVSIHPTDTTAAPTNISTTLELTQFLRENWDIFAWKPSDMPGVPRELAEHRLHVDSTARPVRERLRRSAAHKRKAIGEEVAKLLAANFIREVHHSE